ncbi:MAG: enoyl-CoA hydratase/isomerase family protein [Gemmatimonadetes bacterium]|nr:enoyl-CoA hydratase/isomerase family protein [Gemmatimonadota bacterium]
MAEAPLRVTVRPPVAVVTLARPERLNAVSGPLYEALLREVRRLRHVGEVRALVLTGEGRAFSVGADLKEHGARPGAGEAEPEPAGSGSGWGRRYVRLGQLANLAIQRCPKPVVAAVNGHAIGGGLELALSCDLVVVARDAKLRFPELGLGTFVGGGVTYTLPRRVGLARANELLLLGRFFSGSDAVDFGLANEAVEAGDVLARALAVGAELAERAPIPVRAAKRLLQRAAWSDPRSAMAREAEALLRCMGSRDWREGVASFAERRPPRFTGE